MEGFEPQPVYNDINDLYAHLAQILPTWKQTMDKVALFFIVFIAVLIMIAAIYSAAKPQSVIILDATEWQCTGTHIPSGCPLLTMMISSTYLAWSARSTAGYSVMYNYTRTFREN